MKKEDIYKKYVDFCNEKRFTPDVDKYFWKRWWSYVYGTEEKRITDDGVTVRWVMGVGLNAGVKE